MGKISILIFTTIFNAVLLNQIIITNKIIKIPSYLFSALFIIISLPFINLENYWIIMISTFLFLLSYRELIQLKNPNHKKQRIFKSGFFMSLMIVIDINLIIFYFVPLFALLYYKEFNWRQMIIQCMGLGFSLIFYYIFMLLDYTLIDYMYLSQDTAENNYSIFQQTPITLSLIGFLFIPSGRELYNNYYRKTEHSKKGFVLIYFCTTLTLLYFMFSNNVYFIYFLVIPATIIIGNYLIYLKRRYFRTFLLGLLFIIFLFEFFYL